MFKYGLLIGSVLTVAACGTTPPIKTYTQDVTADALPYYLPKKQLVLQISDSNHPPTFELSELEPEADPEAIFYLDPDHSIFREDGFTIELDDQGMLKSVSVSSEGKVATAFPKAARLLGGIAAFGLVDNDCVADQCISFDPSSEQDLTKIRNSLPNGYSIAVSDMPVEDFPSVSDGIAYRQAEPVTIEVIDETSNIAVYRTTILLPQAGQIKYIPIHASGLSKQTASINFTNGSPTKWESKRPSEFDGFIGLPGQLLKNFLEGPGELLTWRVSSESDVITQENELEKLKLQKTILDECLADAARNDDPNSARLLCYTTFDAN